MIAGRLYDGVTGHPHDVQVSVEARVLRLSQASGWSEMIACDDLVRADAPTGSVRLARRGFPGWRLTVPEAAAGELEPLIGREPKYGRWIDRVGLLPALLIGGAVTAAVVLIGHTAPRWLAPHVPMSWERNLGSAMVGDFGDLRCRSARGQRALEALTERVAPGSLSGPDPIKVAALDVSVFNAAALPGGYIVVFKPAITETDPEALAGVLAHEVAHVRRRHVTEALIRELGIGALIRMFAGGIGANAEQLVALSYTRSNEAEADTDAIKMLAATHISPRPTAELFDRLAKETPDFSAEFLQSHPETAKRARRFAASFDGRQRYSPALNRDQADALFDICRTPRVVK